MEKIKVLHFINSLNYGGAERFLLNLLKNINKEKFQFDIMVRNTPNPMAKEFEKYGANIIYSPDYPKATYKHYKFIKDFVVSEGEVYKYIHMHANSLIYTIPIKLFNKYRSNVKILLHSHSSKSVNLLVTFLHKTNRLFLENMFNSKIAVSKLSGEWMFGKQKFEVVYNGIDIKDFQFDQTSREKIRNEFNINENEILLGSVGRLVSVKNYKLLIEIFKKIIELDSSKNYKLLLVGSGKLEKDLKELAFSYNLEKNVIFTGQREDVSKILSAMDIYLQPSIFEGFPFSVIEAQIANLPTIISDTISEEVRISNNISFKDIKNINEWIAEIVEYSELKHNRLDETNINKNVVDMKIIAKKFEDIYSL